MNKKANLFIVGAMKAGTTSLIDLLASHPAIYFSPIKEPNYFVSYLPSNIYTAPSLFSLETYFENSFPAPLHIAHLKRREHYDKLFSLALDEHKYNAEGSTAYLHAPESPELIHKYNPDAKVIILVRDGLKRAFSHYKMDVGLGRTLVPFEKAIKKDLQAFREGKVDNWSYIGMSLYNENITRFRQIFGDNVIVISFEELLNEKEDTLKRLFSFLDIENKQLDLKHTNESSNIRFKSVIYFLKQSGLKDVLSYLLPLKFRHSVFSLLKKKAPHKMQLEEELRAELNSIFKDDLELFRAS